MAPTKNKSLARTASKKERKKPETFSIDQQFLVIQWLAEGLTTKEMNERSATAKPPFTITSQEAYYYRVTRQIDVEAARLQRESEALNSGFAVRENRIIAINKLATKLYAELTDETNSKLWTDMAKMLGPGQTYNYVEFNKAEIDALRGLWDDMALETGGRVRRSDITSKDKPLGGTGLDPAVFKDLSDEELEILEHAMEIMERRATKQGGDPSSKE